MLRRPALALLAACAALPAQAEDRWQGPLGDAAACGRCHRDVHAEWQDSAHARAFVDPLFQAALATRAEPERCLPCHVPDAVLPRIGQMPRARADHHGDGITCAACHQRGEVLHGPTGAATDAHPTAADAAFLRRGSVGLCTGCHDLRIADVLPLAREFLAAGLQDDGESCVGCHMERLSRAPAGPGETSAAPAGRPGRSHRLLGPADAAFCGSAFLPRIEAGNGGAVLVLTNGAGHGVPGLARLRRFAVRLQLLDRAGRPLHTLDGEFSWQNRLLADEERRILLPNVADAIALHLQVDHIFADRILATVVDRTLELP